MHHNIYASILVMFLTIYAVRALPLTLIRKEIKNPFIQSFLYYVPYVSLSVMTFPSILSATGNRITGLAGFAAGGILAWIVPGLHRCMCGRLYCGNDPALKRKQPDFTHGKPLENIDKNGKQIYNSLIVCPKAGDGEQSIFGIE